MHGVYSYITETNHVSKAYSVAVILYLQSATRNVIPPVKCFVLLHYHFPQYVCSSQYSCFLQFLNFVFFIIIMIIIIIITITII